MDMVNGHKLLQNIYRHDQEIDQTLLEIKTLPELEKKQQDWKALWLDMLGGLPEEKTPLQPQCTGKIVCDGYTVEKILFQSMPGVYVPGYLYLPDDPRFQAPYPAILMVNGHADTGKIAPRYVRMAVMAVKEGFAVFTPDPIGQGERIQQSAEYEWNQCATEHTALGARGWLVGWNFARFRIWDAIRSIDYMETRKELDFSRLAVIGCSGGGTMSSFMLAMDERIKVASPSCYISSLREVVGERGIHDAEQFFYGQLVRGFNHAVLLALGQPRTAVLLDTRHKDYFPIAGARATAALLRQFQQNLQISPKLEIFSSDGSHGWLLNGQTAVLSWLKYTIKGETSRYCRETADGTPVLDVEELRKIPESDFTLPFAEAECNITATGQIRDLPGFKSIYTLIGEEALRLQKERKIDRMKLREIVRKRANIAPLDQLPDAPEPFEHDFKWWYLTGAEGVSVELYSAILAVEGRSLIGERAEMFLRNALKEQKQNGGKPVVLRADGVWCIAAAHAYAVEPQLFASVEFKNPPLSWTEMILEPNPTNDSFAVTVWGALQDYDWTDLVPENCMTVRGNFKSPAKFD